MADPVETSGGGGAANVEPVKAIPQSTAAPVAEPSAAATVANGSVTEETLKLRKDLDDERAARKKVEMDHASVTDDFQRYRDKTEARKVPVKQGKVDDEPPTARRFGFLKRRG